MSKNVVKSLIALGSVLAVATISTGAASAYSQTDYNNQLGGKFGLDYNTWSLFNSFINPEGQGLSGNELVPLNLNDLSWKSGVNNVEVFFINEGAGYRNRFFYSTDNGNTLNTIWNDVASRNSILPDGNGPLSLGEGVSLGNFAGQTQLSFFLQNGYNGSGDILGVYANQNLDNLDHVTAYKSGQYLLLGFEDLTYGGDRDYNDVVIAVKGLVDTQDQASVPEPATTAALLGLGLFGLVSTRRRLTV